MSSKNIITITTLMQAMITIKKLLTVYTILLAVVAIQAQPPGSGWGEPVFSDEFSDEELNTTRWRYNTSTTEFSKDNVVLQDGIMSIHNIYTEDEVATGGWVMSNQAGFVGNNKYGYYEARIRINAPANGQIWPTWWIWGGNWRDGGPAPSTTEFDLMEYSGWAAKYSDNYATSSHHYKGKEEINGTNHATTSTESNKTRNAFEWHTWALLWTPTEVSFWYDGVKYFTSPEPGDAAKEDIEMNLIFSCSPHIGTNPVEANKPVPGVELPSYEIDWVRVWQGGDAYATGIQDVSVNTELRTYPNPLTGNLLTIDCADIDGSVLNLAIYDSSGKKIGQRDLSIQLSVDKQVQINLNDFGVFQQGIYILDINSAHKVQIIKVNK